MTVANAFFEHHSAVKCSLVGGITGLKDSESRLTGLFSGYSRFISMSVIKHWLKATWEEKLYLATCPS